MGQSLAVPPYASNVAWLSSETIGLFAKGCTLWSVNIVGKLHSASYYLFLLIWRVWRIVLEKMFYGKFANLFFFVWAGAQWSVTQAASFHIFAVKLYTNSKTAWGTGSGRNNYVRDGTISFSNFSWWFQTLLEKWIPAFIWTIVIIKRSFLLVIMFS